jgi:uncharacterized lipoprotein YajG
MRNKHLFSLITLAMLFVSGCGSSTEMTTGDSSQNQTPASTSLSKEGACRELKIAIGTYTDISVKSLAELQFDNNAKPIPPSEEIQFLVGTLIESINVVAENAPNEELKYVSEQFALDVSAYHEKAMNQEISLAASAAITDDLTQIQELCPAY